MMPAMGTFFAEVLIASPRAPETAYSFKLLVDTGPTYTWVAASALRALGVAPTNAAGC
jgi:hypothetical protein